MPVLAGAPWRNQPEVELLRKVPITVEEAVGKLDKFIEKHGEDMKMGLDAASVNLNRLPEVLGHLREYWNRSGVFGDEATDCFVEVHGRLEVHLHPCYIGEKLAEGIRRPAFEMLMRYSSVLGCIPLAYTKLKPTGTHGAIVAESPWVHFVADFTAVGFVLAKDKRWLASFQNVKNRKEVRNGINLLSLGFISCFVPKDTLPKEITYSDSGNAWVDEQGLRLREESRPVVINISSFQASADFLDVKGKLEWPPQGHAALASPARLKEGGGSSSATAASSGGEPKAEGDPAPNGKRKKDAAPSAADAPKRSGRLPGDAASAGDTKAAVGGDKEHKKRRKEK